MPKKRRTRRKRGGYRYRLGQTVHVQYPMDGGRWYKWWTGKVVGLQGNKIFVSWGYTTPDGFPARDLIDPKIFPVSPPIKMSGRKKRKSRRKKRGGNEPNWLDVCDAKHNDRNYRHLTDLEADIYCRKKTRNRNSKCIDGECKFIENTRPRNDPSSMYDDDLVRRFDELRDGTFAQREAERERQRPASIAVINRRLAASRSVSPDAETN